MSRIISGGYNILVGLNAGAAITTGSGNIIIGTDAGQEVTTESNLFILDLGSIRIKLQMTPEQSRALYNELNPLIVRAIEAMELEKMAALTR